MNTLLFFIWSIISTLMNFFPSLNTAVLSGAVQEGQHFRCLTSLYYNLTLVVVYMGILIPYIIGSNLFKRLARTSFVVHAYASAAYLFAGEHRAGQQTFNS